MIRSWTFCPSVVELGMRTSNSSIHAMAEKCSAVKNLPEPAPDLRRS